MKQNIQYLLLNVKQFLNTLITLHTNNQLKNAVHPFALPFDLRWEEKQGLPEKDRN